MGQNAGANVQGSANVAIGLNAGANISAANSVSIGSGAIGRELGAVAIGQGALATKARSVAIGSSSVTTVADTVSVGSASKQRRIVNVANAVAATDAVNLRQVQALIAAAPVAPARPVALLAGPVHGISSSVRQQGKAGGARGPDSRDANGGAVHDAAPGGAAAQDGDDDLEPSVVVGWANVSHDGTLSRARNVVGNVRHGVGEYEIVLKKHSLQSCTFNTTLSGAGFIAANPGPLPNSVSVEIRNRYGVLNDASFRLLVVC
jgi:hypothetical protein